MRFGLVGTGPWASHTHGPGLATAEGIELVGVWGRRSQEAGRLAGELGAVAYDDYAAMLQDVEAVAFAVPPDVQVVMAHQAVGTGKHLLLDKPVAIDPVAARTLADAAQANGVASVVFFTDRFSDASREWFRQVEETGGWLGGWMRWFSALQEPDNPFGSSSWRQRLGALWDTGPHALSTLSAALGPVESITAVTGEGDLVVFTLGHSSGAVSTAALTQFGPPAAACFETTVWGREGFSVMPPRPEGSSADALRMAAEELVASAHSGQRHEVDVAFGARIVELLAEAQAQVDLRADPRD